jgi:hypothetical protein
MLNVKYIYYYLYLCVFVCEDSKKQRSKTQKSKQHYSVVISHLEREKQLVNFIVNLEFRVGPQNFALWIPRSFQVIM